MECNFLLDGHVPDFYKFNPSTQIALENPGFVARPAPSERIHCVMFVIDASVDVPKPLVDKIKSFRRQMNQKEIPQVVILTKIDRLSKGIQSDISGVFRSPEVERKVEDVSKLLGVPRNNVLPVKNYENEMQLDESISVLALLALRQVLYFAEDYMENLLMQQEKSGKQSIMRSFPALTSQSSELEVCESDTA